MGEMKYINPGRQVQTNPKMVDFEILESGLAKQFVDAAKSEVVEKLRLSQLGRQHKL